MPNLRDCAGIIRKAARNVIDPAEVEDFIASFERRAASRAVQRREDRVEAQRRSTSKVKLGPADIAKIRAYSETMDEYIDRLSRNRELRRNAELRQKAIFEKLQQELDLSRSDINLTPKKFFDRLYKRINGNVNTKLGERRSLDTNVANNTMIFATKMANDLRDAGVLVEAQSGVHDEDVVNALYGGGRPSDPAAQKIADVYRDLLDYSVDMRNSVGDTIIPLKDNIGEQYSDRSKLTSPTGNLKNDLQLRLKYRAFLKNPDELKEMAYARWRDFVMPRIDVGRMRAELSLGGDDDLEKFLQAYWQNKVTGLHGKWISEDPLTSDQWFSARGRKIGDRLGAHRLLHFKGASEQLEYIREYGRGNLFDNMTHTMLNSGRLYAVMKDFGNNPMALYMHLKNFTLKYHSKRISANDANWEKLAYDVQAITGGTETEENMFGSFLKANLFLTTMAKMGGFTKWLIADINTALSKMTESGMSTMESYGFFFKSLTDGASREARKQIADHLGLSFKLGGSHAARYLGGEDMAPAAFHNIMMTLNKLNLMHQGDSFLSGTLGSMLSQTVAEAAAHPYAEADENLKMNLKAYGIDERHWDALRAGTREIEHRGKMFKYVTPDSLVEPTTQGLSKEMQDLRYNLNTFFGDQINDGFIQASGVTRRQWMLRKAPNTLAGQLLQTFTAFKTWMHEYYKRTYYRQFVESDGNMLQKLYKNRTGRLGIVRFMVQNMVSAMLIKTMDSVLENETPPNFFTPKEMAQMLVESGAGGMMGMALAHDYSSYGGNVWDTLMGKPATNIADIIKAVDATVTQKPNQAKEWWRLFNDYVPANNLFYIRGPLNLMFGNELEKAINPQGYQRYQTQLEQNNQHSIF